MVVPIERRISEVRLVYNVPGEIVRMALGWPKDYIIMMLEPTLII